MTSQPPRVVEVEVGVQGQSGRLFDQKSRYTVSFSASYGTASGPPEGRVTILNPPEDLARTLRSAGRQAFLRISAGYGVPEVLFAGASVRDGVALRRDGGDWRLDVKALSGGEAYRNALVRREAQDDVGFEAAVRSAIEETGAGVGALDLSLAPGTLPRGSAFDGPAHRLLAAYARMARAEIHYDGGKISFLRTGVGIPNGLERAPVFSSEDKTLYGDVTETDKGLSFKGRLTYVPIGQQVRVRYFDPFASKVVEETLVARETDYVGGNKTDDFCVKIRARKHRPQPASTDRPAVDRVFPLVGLSGYNARTPP